MDVTLCPNCQIHASRTPLATDDRRHRDQLPGAEAGVPDGEWDWSGSAADSARAADVIDSQTLVVGQHAQLPAVGDEQDVASARACDGLGKMRGGFGGERRHNYVRVCPA